MKVPRTVCLGRLQELAAHPLAERLAIRPLPNWDYEVKDFKSRAFLKSALKGDTKWSAVVKDVVSSNMLISRAFQVARDS